MTHLPVEQLPQLARTLSCIGARWKILIVEEIEFFRVGAR